MKKVAWSLDNKDVSRGYVTSSRNGRFGKGLTRSSRSANVSSVEVRLKHIPTGITVVKEVAEGYYSRQELKKIREKNERELFFVLEAKVAKELKIPGYFQKAV
jgi:glycerol-3-phosphate dehydrogenase